MVKLLAKEDVPSRDGGGGGAMSFRGLIKSP